MSSITKIVVGLAALAALSACGNSEPEEVVIVDPAPVVVEPVTTKY
ncbi:hypothetical protein MWU52_06960 [Jannaschia sp. S6380]|nr:hypothetical protein [Jannaschia sp. S6380]MCK0167285.1 hypothetical protein [Jannaschia sp. S6380]